jgi:glycosyltransferase involved in cell wall biosynthesis
MNLLIYDSIYSNHLIGYLRLIIKSLAVCKKYNEIHIILDACFLKDHKMQLDQISSESGVKIFISSLPNEMEVRLKNTSNLVLKSILEERFINSFCAKNQINSVIFLYLDYFQIALGIRALFFMRRRITFSGILFASFFYQRRRNFKRFVKWMQLRILLLNTEFKKIFILNDEKLVSHLNNQFKTTEIFNYLPDPIERSTFNNLNIREKFKIDSEDFLFISLGRVTERKNIHNIIIAFENLPDKYLQHAKLLICGSFDNHDYKSRILDLISEKIRNNVILVDEFLDKNDFDAIIAASDCVCTVYKDFYGSSGIVGNAANFKKLVLASDFGTIGYIVGKFKLGVTVNPLCLSSIQVGMYDILNHYDFLLKIANFDEYLEVSSPEKFTQVLLS